MKTLTPISVTLQRLATGEVTSLSLANECLDAIAAPDGEGRRAFTRVAPDAVRGSRFAGRCGTQQEVRSARRVADLD